MKELLERYASIKERQKRDEEELESLSNEITLKITEQGADKINADGIGTFTIAKRKLWKYSEQVEHTFDQLKSMKDEEQANGEATFIENPYLIFKAERKETV